jgi:hypothetical protein
MACHPERRSEPRQHSEDKWRACPERTPSVSEGESNGDLVCLAASPNAVLAKYVLLAAIVLLTTAARSDCIAVPEAKKHIGEVKCVAGVVVRVKQGARGVHFLDFCDDFRLCPFTVVIFPRDLKSVGDVRQLQGRMVEIHGQVKEYDGRAEIILEEYRQLGGAGARIPPLPKNYDVEKKGRYSAGTFSHPKSKRKTSKRQPAEVVTQAPEDPEQ